MVMSVTPSVTPVTPPTAKSTTGVKKDEQPAVQSATPLTAPAATPGPSATQNQPNGPTQSLPSDTSPTLNSIFRNLLSAKALPTEDNLDNEEKDTKVFAGINQPFGLDGTPMISPQLNLGISYFAFVSNEMQLPKSLRDLVTSNPRVKKVSDDFDNNGFAVVTGVNQYACVFYVKSDSTYTGASIGGWSILGSDPAESFASVYIAQEDYNYTDNDSVPKQSDAAQLIHAESVHALLSMGNQDYSAGVKIVNYRAMIDDNLIGESTVWGVDIQVHDLERVFSKTDTDFSLGAWGYYNSDNSYGFGLNSGPIALIFKGERDGGLTLSPYLQGGLGIKIKF